MELSDLVRVYPDALSRKLCSELITGFEALNAEHIARADDDPAAPCFTELNLTRCEAIVRRTRELFPAMTDGRGAQFWTGLRPATPSNLPYIGASHVPNVYLNTGHGTLGWTHACGSAAAIADIVSGRRPVLDYAFTAATQERMEDGDWRFA